MASLCLHHNGVAAVSAALIAGVLATVLEIAGLGTLPVVRHRWFDGQIRGIVFGPYLAAYSAFLLALLFWRWPDRVMFLDKICIHQTDAELTRRGIASINPIIRSSSSLLLCYEPDAAPGEDISIGYGAILSSPRSSLRARGRSRHGPARRAASVAPRLRARSPGGARRGPRLGVRRAARSRKLELLEDS